MGRHETTRGGGPRAATLAMMLACLAATPARASGDGCAPEWRLDLGTLQECENVAAPTPGNDTRANLMLLMSATGRGATPQSGPVASPVMDWPTLRDHLAGVVPGGAPDGGDAPPNPSRCDTDGTGRAAFDAAVTAAPGLPADERDALVTARGGSKADCLAPGAAPPAPLALTSRAGAAFATYLRASTAFYDGRFEDAAREFGSLRDAPDPWLADASGYMVARTLVNRLQVGAFDEYGTFKGGQVVDGAVADEADASLADYLARHPRGRYAASAKGLRRRVAWLAGRRERLASLYAALLAEPEGERGVGDAALAQEIDAKLLPGLTPAATRDPTLLATIDLRDMRVDPKGRRARVDLEAQRDAFAGAPALYEFLVGTRALYDDGDPRAAARAVPDDARRRDGDRLWFGRQLLRGRALEAAGDRNARGFWVELHAAATRPDERDAVALAVALLDERRGDVAASLEPGSPVDVPGVRETLLAHDAGPDVLAARARDPGAPAGERRTALHALLFKDLTRGREAEFLRELPSVANMPPRAPAPGPDAWREASRVDGGRRLELMATGPTAGDVGCPDLRATAATLERDPRSVRGRLCLAEFVRVNEMDGEPVDVPAARGVLGAGPSDFPGTPYARSATYADVIADPAATPDERAFALARAVRCYQPSATNQCGGPDVPKATRRGWYDTLKRRHAGSRWARGLTLWW